ncbi:MAG: Ig-like domain-containing protein, partial [Bifidobacteriaceae bacterium]|nr:Ig-like domain-containing protein [Bifidobacteriaceae bacterium]
FERPGPVGIVPPDPPKTDAAGQAAVTFTAKTADRYAIRALIGADGLALDPAEISFAPGPLDAAVSGLEGPTHSALADGTETLTVRAFARDLNANPIAGTLIRFAVPAGVDVAGQAPGTTSVEVKAGSDGVASVKLSSTKAGFYTVTAEAQAPGGLSWSPIEKNSPVRLQFAAGAPDAAVSQIARSPAGPLPVGPNASYQVTARLSDRHGNPVEQAGTQVRFAFFRGGDPGAGAEAFCRQDDPAAQEATAATGADGVASVKFSTTLAGPWHGCAFVDG